MPWIESSPNPAPNELLDCAREIEGKQNKRAIFWISDMEIGLVRKFYCNRHEIFPNGPDQDVALILDSPGGDIHAAYHLARFIRRHCGQLTIYVPRWAKSAAVLLCLVADEIVMGEISELGPLDPQAFDPTAIGGSKSILDEYQALETLRTYALETLDSTVRVLLAGSRMAIPDVLGFSTVFVADLMKPLYEQVEPATVGGQARALSISKEYAERLISVYSPVAERINIDDLLQQLVYEYPSHSFAISFEEAAVLGLPARLFSDEEQSELDSIVSLLDHVRLVGALPDEGAQKGNGTKAAGKAVIKTDAEQIEGQTEVQTDMQGRIPK